MSISFMADRRFRLSTINSQLRTALESLLRGALAKQFGNIEVHEIGVMENDRLDRAPDLGALVNVGGDDVHDLAGNPVLVSEGDATEWVPHLLAEFSLNHFTCLVLVVLHRFA